MEECQEVNGVKHCGRVRHHSSRQRFNVFKHQNIFWIFSNQRSGHLPAMIVWTELAIFTKMLGTFPNIFVATESNKPKLELLLNPDQQDCVSKPNQIIST